MTADGVKLTFLGAAGNVTGSCCMVECGGSRVLVDCGMFQERGLRERNWADPAFPLESVNSVLLTHAHLDHCGLLPRLVGLGYRGPVFCTPATRDVAAIVLADSARLQEEDTAFKLERHEREKRQSPHPVKPLYTEEDVRSFLPLIRTVGYGTPVPVALGTEAEWREAGHILGSASIRITLNGNGIRRTVHFSGDLGRIGKPILQDPAPAVPSDVFVVESTYGNRIHDDRETSLGALADAISTTLSRGGKVLIPSFAVERAHEVLYDLNTLVREGKLGHIRVILDSPMAQSITQVFRHHPELYDGETRKLIAESRSPFELPGLSVTRTGGESRSAVMSREPAVIISGSGMCTGGRIKHHLAENIGRPECTVFFVGYQAEGTLGRELVEGARTVRINGEERDVRARVLQAHGYSAHADKTEITGWLAGAGKAPERVLVNHGEPDAAAELAKRIGEVLGWKATVPAWRQEIPLD